MNLRFTHRLKIILLLLAGLVLWLDANAQYFSRQYPLLGQYNGYLICSTVRSDTVYTCGIVSDTNNLQRAVLHFSKIDRIGNMISQWTLDVPGRYEQNPGYIIPTNDGGFFVSAAMGNGLGYDVFLNIKLDRNGDYQWHRLYSDSNYLRYSFAGVVQDSASNYYMCGVAIAASNPNGTGIEYLVKFDSLANFLFMKFYPNQGINENLLSILINKKGNIVMSGGGNNNPVNFTTLLSKSIFRELDTAGNLIRSKFSSWGLGPSPTNLIQTNDGGYIIANGTIIQRATDRLYCKATVAKLDSDFNIIWQQSTGPISEYSVFWDLTRLPDSSYAAVCTPYIADTLHNNSHFYGMIVRFKEDGTILWDRLYRGVYGNPSVFPDDISDNGFNSVNCFSDGSIIALGKTVDKPIPPCWEKGWAVLVDPATGCIPDSNTCGYTGVEEVDQKGIGQIKAYPNPTPDRINLEYALEPSDAVHTFRIFNLLGQTLYETILEPTKGSSLIDIRDWDNGIYYYQVSGNSNVRKTGSIVVAH